MKKTLLTILTAGAIINANAQIPSPAWATLQNTNYTLAASMSSKFLDVVNSNVVWSVGYSGAAVGQNYVHFSRTINGGATFNTGPIYSSTVNPSLGDTNTYVISNLDAIDANTAWVGAFKKSSQTQGAIHKTTNGGATWTNMTAVGMFTNSSSFCNVVAFLTPSIGITQGDPNPGVGNEFEIWRTTDGGTTWNLVPGANIPNPSSSNEYGLVNLYEKQGTSNLWFGTNAGRVFRSTDAGLTWSVTVLPGTPSASIQVVDIAFSNANSGICIAYNSSVTPSVPEQYITSNGGASWTKVATLDPNMGLNDVAGVPGTGVFVSAANSTTASSGFLSYSKDGGLTWTNWGGSGIPYLAIDFADATSGWAATFQASQSAPTGGIYKFNGATSIFSAPNGACFSGPSATIAPVNMSLGNATVSYTWSSSPAAMISSTSAANPIITFTAPGSYVVSLAASNGTSSSSSATINVTSCTTPTADFSVPTGTLCNKVALNFTNTTSGSPTPTYTWSTIPAAGVTISPNANATSPSITFSTGGTYTVSMLASSIAGSVVVNKTITVNTCTAAASFTIPATVCSTAAIVPNNTTSGPGPISYTWSTAPTGSVVFLPNAVAANPTINISGIAVYTITLRAGNASGLSITTQTIDVQNCVGINEAKFSNLTDISPNPTTGNLKINLPTNGDYNVVVVDVLGSIIVNEKIINGNSTNLNLTGKSKGVYFITISNKVDKVTRKIVLE